MTDVIAPKFYTKATGIFLAIIGLTGFILPSKFLGFLTLETNHNILHLLLGAIALYVGFAGAPKNQVLMYSKAFGIGYLLLGLAGFAYSGTLSFIGVSLGIGENITHVLLGLWGIASGFRKN